MASDLKRLVLALSAALRKEEAAQAYEEALRTDPAFADCCYNLALICQELGRQRDAIRHMARYRKLRRGQ